MSDAFEISVPNQYGAKGLCVEIFRLTISS